MIKTEFVEICQRKTQERKANEYIQKNNKIRKCRKAVLGVIIAAFFIASIGIVEANDLETERATSTKDIVLEVTER